MNTFISPRKSGWFIAGIWMIFLITVALAGWAYFQNQEKEFGQAARDSLRAIADLKARQIAQWYRDQWADAEVTMRNPMILSNTLQFLAKPREEQRGQDLLAWMEAVRDLRHYSLVALWNDAGEVRLVVPPEQSLQDSHYAERLQAALRAKTVTATDLHRGSTNETIHLGFWMPVGIKPGAGELAEGAFLFQVDPQQFLYALIQAWPTPSRTAETLLVRQEGGEVIFLNELRHRTNTALTLRLPLTQAQLPAAKAVFGHEGIVEGLDYRGVPVLAATRAIAGTPWYMVAKVDQSELFAGLRERAWVTAIITLALWVAASLGVAFVWKQQKLEYVAQQLGERKRGEEALQESEQRFRLLVQDVQDYAIYMLDAKGLIRTWNAGAQRLKGYQAEEIIGQHFSIFYVPEDIAAGKPQHVLAEAAAHGRAEDERWRVRKDGSRFWANVVITAIRDAAGNLWGYAKISRDLTERKRAEEALRRANRQLQMLSECNQMLVRTNDEASLLAEICRMVVETGGYRLAWVGLVESDEAKSIRPVAQAGVEQGYLESLGLTWADTERGQGLSGVAVRKGQPYVCQDILNDPRFAPWREQAMTRGYSSCASLPLIHEGRAFGTLTIYSTEAQAFDKDELVILMELANDLAFGLDALRERAARAKAEAALQLQFERMPIAYITWNPQFRVTAWNPAAEKIFGYSAREALGQHPYGLIVPKEVQAQVDRIWNRLLEGDTAAHSLNVNQTKDGRTILCDWHNTPLRNREGQVMGVLSMAQDVTERERAEEEIRQLNQTLEKRVQQRTAQLEAANKELEAFSYSVSHDLRAPLRAVDGFSEMLMEGYSQQLDGEAQRVLKVICSESKRMGQLIDDLLNFSRLGRCEMAYSEVNMEKLAQTVWEEIQRLAPSRPVHWELKPLPPAKGDASLLRHVLTNLLSNAFKFTQPRNPARIEMGAISGETETIYYVKDNGVGFDMRYVQKLFCVFQRLHSLEEFSGTGVGLALVKRIIQRHGERVWAEGKVGEGATFYFTLPNEKGKLQYEQ